MVIYKKGIYKIYIYHVIYNWNKFNESVNLVSKSDKGNRYFKMLSTGKFQHYDSPKGELSSFTKGEEDRKRLVSKLSKADKKTYKEWIKTPDGSKSLNLFKINEGFKDDKSGFSLEQLMDHTNSYKNNVRNDLHHIVCNTKGISEKSFTQLDELSNKLESFYENNKKDLDSIINEFNDNDYRSTFCAETIYSKYSDNL
jgi:hypothetical protein